MHLVMPERPLFSRDKVEPSASIVVKVRGALEASVPNPSRLGNPAEYASLALEMIRNGYFNAECVRLDGAIRGSWCPRRSPA